jgi:hypothetical protein
MLVFLFKQMEEASLRLGALSTELHGTLRLWYQQAFKH